jgi:hypothetical protein
MPLKSCFNIVKTLCLNNISTMFYINISLCFLSMKHIGYGLLNVLKDILYLFDYFQTYFDIILIY